MAAAVMLPGVLAMGALGPRYGGEVTVGVPNLPLSHAPSMAHGLGARLLGALVHETLVGIDGAGYPTPGLAAQWSSAAAGREWTLTLRADARSHDGHDLSSEHVERSLRRFLRSRSPAAEALSRALDGGADYRRRQSEELAGLLSPAADRLVLRYREPRALPFISLAAASAAITGERGSGCGPFVPTLPLPGGSGLVLTAFAAHTRGRPFLDRVRILAIPDPAEMHAAFEAGRLQLAPGGAAASAPVATLLLVLDPSRPPFDDPEGRVAVAAALDRPNLVRHFLSGGDPAYALLPPVLLPPLASTQMTGETAGLNGRVTMAVARDVPPIVSQRVVAHLAALGLEVSVSAVEGALLRDAEAHARLFFWIPEVPEASLALRELQGLAPATPEVEHSLTAAEKEPNLDRRRVLLHHAERALRQQAALIPLAAVPVSLSVRHGVHGVSLDAAGRLDLGNVWVEP